MIARDLYAKEGTLSTGRNAVIVIFMRLSKEGTHDE